MRLVSRRYTIRRCLGSESGYSLVEVMVAIMLLAIAIIPMVGMFDAGLRAAVLGGNYDSGRALANEKLEEVKALPYDRPGSPADSIVEKYPPLNGSPAGSAVTCLPSPSDYAPFTCKIETRYVSMANGGEIVADATSRMMMEINVNVTWDGGGKSYSTIGLVSQESPEPE